MKLEVGKYYRNRTGEVVFIKGYFEEKPFPYFDGEDSYLPTGRFFNCEEAPRDLIEEVAFISEVNQPENKEIDIKPEVEDELRAFINNHRLSTDEAISLIKKVTTQPPKLNPDDFYYPNAINWMWNFPQYIPLGKYVRHDCVKFDLGVYESPDNVVCYAIVYGDNEGDTVSSEIVLTQTLSSTLKEAIRRYLNR